MQKVETKTGHAKRLLALLLTCAMLCSFLPVGALAAGVDSPEEVLSAQQDTYSGEWEYYSYRYEDGIWTKEGEGIDSNYYTITLSSAPKLSSVEEKCRNVDFFCDFSYQGDIDCSVFVYEKAQLTVGGDVKVLNLHGESTAVVSGRTGRLNIGTDCEWNEETEEDVYSVCPCNATLTGGVDTIYLYNTETEGWETLDYSSTPGPVIVENGVVLTKRLDYTGEWNYYSLTYENGVWTKSGEGTDGKEHTVTLSQTPDLSALGQECYYVDIDSDLNYQGDVNCDVYVYSGAKLTVDGNIQYVSLSSNGTAEISGRTTELCIETICNTDEVTQKEVYSAVSCDATLTGGVDTITYYDAEEGEWVALDYSSTPGPVVIEKGKVITERVPYAGEYFWYMYAYQDGEWTISGEDNEGNSHKERLDKAPDLSQTGYSTVEFWSDYTVEGYIAGTAVVEDGVSLTVNGSAKDISLLGNATLTVSGEVENLSLNSLWKYVPEQGRMVQTSYTGNAVVNGGVGILTAYDEEEYATETDYSATSGPITVKDGKVQNTAIEYTGEFATYFYTYTDGKWVKEGEDADGKRHIVNCKAAPDLSVPGYEKVSINSDLTLQGDIAGTIAIYGDIDVTINGNISGNLNVYGAENVCVNGHVHAMRLSGYGGVGGFAEDEPIELPDYCLFQGNVTVRDGVDQVSILEKNAEDSTYDYTSSCVETFRVEEGVLKTLPKEHSISQYVSDDNATCQKDGTKTGLCTNCGAKVTVADVGSQRDHQYGEYVSNGDATCQKDGTETACCIWCKKTVTRTAENSRLAHTPGEAKRENEKSATCAVAGSYEEVVCCADCGEEISRTTKTIDKLAHTAGDWTVTTAATYKAKGTETRVCTVCGETVGTREIAMLTLAAPKITKTENAATGVKLTWGKVTGAEKYRVYYKVSGASSWTKMDVTGTTATVTKLDSGKSYIFTVKAFAGSNYSEPATYITFAYCAMPTVSKTENTSTGVKVTWSKVTGATKYRVYYKLSDASKYTKFKDVTGTSATVTGLTAGKSYIFTVKAYNGSTWSANKASSALLYRPVPTVSKLTNAAKGITVTWTKISGATKYALYYKVSGASSWTRVSNTLTANSATVTGLTSGKSYVFTVKAYVGGGWSTNVSSSAIVRVNAVTLSGLTNSASKTMKATWKKDTTLTGYQIQYSLKSDFSDAKTVTVKSNSTVSQTIKSLTKGKTYYVRIRGYKTVSKVTTYGAWSASKTVKISK